MSILLLGPESKIEHIIRQNGSLVARQEGPITSEFVSRGNFLFAVSYGYRHIIRSDVLLALKGRIINLHISFLPWNRGADPNLWSFLEDTPKGVTIHWMDAGLDTGDILVQERITFNLEETLSTSYSILEKSIFDLFSLWWPHIITGKAPRSPQPKEGTFHRSKDKEPYLPLLTKGWDTPVRDLIGKALAERRNCFS